MTTTNHAITGALIATVVKQPYLAIPLAFASHFVCDLIPHFELKWKFNSRKMWIRLTADGLTALAVAIFLIINGVSNPVFLAVCGFAAMSPDLAWLYYGIRSEYVKKHGYDWLSRQHARFNWWQKPAGFVIEAAWLIAGVALILKLQ